MNISPSTFETVAVLLLSLQRICRNLSQLLDALDANIDSVERLLMESTTSIHESSSLSNIEDEEDFYERLCDDQLEPKVLRVTTL